MFSFLGDLAGGGSSVVRAPAQYADAAPVHCLDMDLRDYCTAQNDDGCEAEPHVAPKGCARCDTHAWLQC
jgi:hypothetical protein